MLAEMAALPSGIPQGMESRNIVVGPFQAQAQSKSTFCTRHSECQRRCGKEMPPSVTGGGILLCSFCVAYMQKTARNSNICKG